MPFVNIDLLQGMSPEGRTTQRSENIENARVFDVTDGNFVSAKIHTDTAGAVKTAG
ncbi:hypothetical protein [Streptomyces sp. NPDC006638]|uniref:hypothetical protein n=1 Tax=Streptomyces sp. NPDC006638 TaxID=3157183 RepID=UPI0033B3CF1E